MLDVYDSRDIGLFVVLVAKNNAVSLEHVQSGGITAETNAHDVLGMPVHDGISEIKTFEIGYGGSLDLFWEAKVTA